VCLTHKKAVQKKHSPIPLIREWANVCSEKYSIISFSSILDLGPLPFNARFEYIKAAACCVFHSRPLNSVSSRMLQKKRGKFLKTGTRKFSKLSKTPFNENDSHLVPSFLMIMIIIIFVKDFKKLFWRLEILYSETTRKLL